MNEFLAVMSYSRRTWVAVYLSIFSALAILIVGYFQLVDLTMPGSFGPIGDALKMALWTRYEMLALYAFGSFMWLAAKFYLKDRKRLFAMV